MTLTGFTLQLADYEVPPLKPPGTSLCQHCGTPFHPRMRTQKFCRPRHTAEHRNARRREERAIAARVRAAVAHRRLAERGQLTLEV